MKYRELYVMTEKYDRKKTVKKIDEGVRETIQAMAKWFRDVLVAIFGKNAESVAAEAQKILVDETKSVEDRKVGIYNNYVTMVNNGMPEAVIKKYRRSSKNESVYRKMFHDMLNEADDKTGTTADASSAETPKGTRDTFNQVLPKYVAELPGNIVNTVQKDANTLELTIKNTDALMVVVKNADSVSVMLKKGNDLLSDPITYAKGSPEQTKIMQLYDTAAKKTNADMPNANISELPYSAVYLNLVPIKNEDIKKGVPVINARFKIIGYASYPARNGTFAIYDNPTPAKIPDKYDNLVRNMFEEISKMNIDKSSGQPIFTFKVGSVNSQVDVEQGVEVVFNEKAFKRITKEGGGLTFSVKDFKKYPKQFQKIVDALEKSPLKTGEPGIRMGNYVMRRLAGKAAYPLYIYATEVFKDSTGKDSYNPKFGMNDAAFNSPQNRQAMIKRVNDELAQYGISVTDLPNYSEITDGSGKFKYAVLNPAWQIAQVSAPAQ